MDWLYLVAITIALVLLVCLGIYLRTRQRSKNAAHKGRGEQERGVLREHDHELEEVIEVEFKPLAPEIKERPSAPCTGRQRLPQDMGDFEDTLNGDVVEARSKALEKAEEARQKTKRIDPVKRGGRPRGSALSDLKQDPRERGSRPPKPEVVCWKTGTQWILGLEVPEELLEDSELSVLQNGSYLHRDDWDERRWHLGDVTGTVVVQPTEGDFPGEIQVRLGEVDYLVFKLGGRTLSEGRRIMTPSSGWYLAIVPEDWQRDATSGSPPVTPEYVSINRYRAHYFLLQQGGCEGIAFQAPDGSSVVVESRGPKFELVGTRLVDASDDMGALFARQPPRISAIDQELWQEVQTIVVGEEGPDKGRWRTQFDPSPRVKEQPLPSEVMARRTGWYFLRLYDQTDELVDSLDFRFISSLRDIRLVDLSPSPLEDGHGPAQVEFLHDSGCRVQPLNDVEGPIQIKRGDEKTVLVVPPDPTLDLTRWHVGAENGPHVEVVLLVERVWWALAVENMPSNWVDKHLTISPDDLAATSDKAIWLRMPKPRWVDSIRVGFDQAKSRSYSLKVEENTVAIPLREFGDFEEASDGQEDVALKVWIEHRDWSDEVVLAVLPAWETRVEETVTGPALRQTARWLGLGRKKTAQAVAQLCPGLGEIKVNGHSVGEYFSHAPMKAKQFLNRLLELEEVQHALSELDATVAVHGSNQYTTRQVKAVTHALARGLISYDPSLKRSLREAGFGGVKVRALPNLE
jgi:small subunit ribosomal protein S9